MGNILRLRILKLCYKQFISQTVSKQWILIFFCSNTTVSLANYLQHFLSQKWVFVKISQLSEQIIKLKYCKANKRRWFERCRTQQVVLNTEKTWKGQSTPLPPTHVHNLPSVLLSLPTLILKLTLCLVYYC